MRYEIRKRPNNKFQLREGLKLPGKSPRPGARATAVPAPTPEPAVLGEFDSTEAAAQFALKHERGEFEWRPFDPQGELDRQRAQLEGNLRG